jgi:hypothetical protein
VPDGLDTVSISPLTENASSKTLQRWQVHIKFVAKFHCKTCRYPFEEEIYKITSLSNPVPVEQGEDAQARSRAVGLIKRGWNMRHSGRRLSKGHQLDYFTTQGWNKCHENTKKKGSGTLQKISSEPINEIMSMPESVLHLRTLSVRL